MNSSLQLAPDAGYTFQSQWICYNCEQHKHHLFFLKSLAAYVHDLCTRHVVVQWKITSMNTSVSFNPLEFAIVCPLQSSDY